MLAMAFNHVLIIQKHVKRRNRQGLENLLIKTKRYW